MSSMLKKTGGLSFKPKAGRRPGAASKPAAATSSTAAATASPSSSASVPPTRAPTTEPPPEAPISTVVDPAETTTTATKEPPVPTELLPIPAVLQTLSHSQDSTETPAPSNSVVSAVSLPPLPPSSPPVAQAPTPQPSNELPGQSAPSALPPELHTQTTEASRNDAQPTISSETRHSPPRETGHSSTTTTTPETTLESSAPEEDETPRPYSTPSPLPVTTATATSLPSQTTTIQLPAPKKQAPRKRKSTVTNGEGGADGTAPKQRRQRTKSTTQPTAEASDDMSTEVSKHTRRRKREPTPENAEELTVDHSTLTMGELTKDLGIGKRFRHADEIAERAREARAKYRLKSLERKKRKLGLIPPEDDDLLEQPDTSNDNGGSRGAAIAELGAAIESGAAQSVGYDVVDGQIVVHAASLVVDRHNQDMSALEEVEENDFTNLVTSASYAKRVQGPGNWPEEDTEKFYRLLGMFGTDFETISRLFPGKNRRAIKLKFNKEERQRPNRVNAAMMVRGQKKVNIDIEEYKATQRQWQAKDKILAEHAQLAEEREREVSRLREERRAAGLIDDVVPAAASKQTTTDADGYEVIEEDADAIDPQRAVQLEGEGAQAEKVG
ncbi:hypothetical protein F4808DRAFT_440932 [Astrocystis sublimbata]|nr:hypothetical protein F4808DRAFT_440932 [Astrocystis sublimbata]